MLTPRCQCMTGIAPSLPRQWQQKCVCTGQNCFVSGAEPGIFHEEGVEKHALRNRANGFARADHPICA